MLFTKQEMRKLIVPLLIEQALAVTIGMADTVMVAQAGEAAVSGVSLVDSVNLLLLYFVGAFSTGGAIVISQALGAKDTVTVKAASKQLIWISTLVALAISLLMVFTRRGLLRLIFGSISDEIMANAQIYFLYTALSYPFIALRNAGAAIYRAYGNSKISMYISFAANLINIVGNALLIFVFHMGAAGAAIATLFSRIIGAGIMMVFVCDKHRPVYVERIMHFRPDFKLIKRILGIGIPSAMENSMFQFGKVVTQSIISTFGSVAIAANAAANTFCSLMYIPGTAVGAAMTAVIGRCVGAGEKQQAKIYARRLTGLVYAIVIAMSLVLCIFSPQLISTFNLSSEAATLAIRLFVFHNICVATIWPTAFTLPNSFRAAGDVMYTMVVSIASMWILRVGGGYFFARILDFGVIGVWYGMGCDWILRTSMFLFRYLKGTWLHKKRS